MNTRKMMMTVMLLGSLLVAAGCGVTDAHCDFKDSAGKLKRCQERLGSLANAGFKATGGAAGGTCSDGPCVRTGAVGGCYMGDQGDGSKINDWYYLGTSADATKTCSDDKGTFLTP